jgi:signal transduction histidine kinase
VEDLVAVSRRTDDDASLIERATHDLLNPVASILGLAETIRARGAELDDETLKTFGSSISRQVTRLESSIRDLGRASRLLREGLSIDAQSVSLDDVMATFARDRLQVEASSESAVLADPFLLADVLSRLVDNALAYSNAEVIVRASRGWIEVADSGTGFTAEGLAAAFEPLSAGTNARGERSDGLGLGLFIARRLVEAMGGTLTATSAPGEGSVFRISLPS